MLCCISRIISGLAWPAKFCLFKIAILNFNRQFDFPHFWSGAVTDLPGKHTLWRCTRSHQCRGPGYNLSGTHRGLFGSLLFLPKGSSRAPPATTLRKKLEVVPIKISFVRSVSVWRPPWPKRAPEKHRCLR